MTAASHCGVGSTDGLGFERPGQELLATRPSQEAAGLESFTYRACLSLGDPCLLPHTGTVAPPVEAGVYGHRETHRHTDVVDTHMQTYTPRYTQTHKDTCTHTDAYTRRTRDSSTESHVHMYKDPGTHPPC